MSGPVTVAQADRDAYNCLMQDEHYDHEPAGAWHFARHRTAAEAASAGIMAELVEALEDIRGRILCPASSASHALLLDIASKALARAKGEQP